MNKKLLILLFVLIIISGCIRDDGAQTIKLVTIVEPSKVALDFPEPIYIKVRAANIGMEDQTINASVISSEGLFVSEPPRTIFTLKSGESREITFEAELSYDAVPGDYRIDVVIWTEAYDKVTQQTKLRVVEKRGIL